MLHVYISCNLASQRKQASMCFDWNAVGGLYIEREERKISVCLDTHIYIYIYVCVCVRVCLRCMYVMHACMHASMYACMRCFMYCNVM